MNSTESILPAPGIYENVPDAEYRAWPALSKSTLEYGHTSMLHLKAAVDGMLVRDDTAALSFGRALHARLLEPARFKADYAAMPVFEQNEPGKYKNYKASSEYKAKEAEFLSANDRKAILSDSDAACVEAMAKSVYAHPGVAMLRENGGSEVSITWKHSTGLDLKGRLDKFTRFQGLPTILDIKGVRSCDPEDLSRQIMDLGWHRQGAMYIDGIKAITSELADFILICVEKTYPYAVSVQQVAERSISLGRHENITAIQRWARALETGIYEGFGNDIGQIDVPEWYLKQNNFHKE